MVRAFDLLQLMVMSSNPCNMAVFQLFRMAAAAIVDFKIFIFLTTGTFKTVKLTVPNFVEIAPTATEI